MAATASRPRRPAGFSPLVQKRRPATSLPDRYQSFAASPRIKSAVLTMPRSHVSIARFYDWSEDLGECVSVSKFYRDLAASQKHDKVKGKTKWCSNGVHINPGRMFLRDKAGLTKGEREIIEGIYRNRGDIQNENESFQRYTFKDEWDFVRSHKDAWAFGRQLQRHGFRFDPQLDLKLPEYLFSRMMENRQSSQGELCKTCETKFENDSFDIDSGWDCVHKKECPVAPPTTPDRETRKEPENKEHAIDNKKKVTVFKNEHEKTIHDQRVRVVRSVDESSVKDKGDNKKKVYVNVFLPRIPSDLSHDQSVSIAAEGRKNSYLSDFSKYSVRDTPRNKLKSDLSISSQTIALTESQRLPSRSRYESVVGE